jgi:hypothetical protein
MSAREGAGGPDAPPPLRCSRRSKSSANFDCVSSKVRIHVYSMLVNYYSCRGRRGNLGGDQTSISLRAMPNMKGPPRYAG